MILWVLRCLFNRKHGDGQTMKGGTVLKTRNDVKRHKLNAYIATLDRQPQAMGKKMKRDNKSITKIPPQRNFLEFNSSLTSLVSAKKLKQTLLPSYLSLQRKESMGSIKRLPSSSIITSLSNRKLKQAIADAGVPKAFTSFTSITNRLLDANSNKSNGRRRMKSAAKERDSTGSIRSKELSISQRSFLSEKKKPYFTSK